MFKIATITAELVHTYARLSGSIEGLLLSHAILALAMLTERHVGRRLEAFAGAMR